MTNLSKRAAIEKDTSTGFGVSTAVRKYWRNHFKSVPSVLGSNDDINTYVAGDFKQAPIVHKFMSHSGEIAQIRKSNNFYYLGIQRSSGQIDIIFIQPSIKQPSEEVRKKRLESLDWTKKYYRG